MALAIGRRCLAGRARRSGNDRAVTDLRPNRACRNCKPLGRVPDRHPAPETGEAAFVTGGTTAIDAVGVAVTAPPARQPIRRLKAAIATCAIRRFSGRKPSGCPASLSSCARSSDSAGSVQDLAAAPGRVALAGHSRRLAQGAPGPVRTGGVERRRPVRAGDRAAGTNGRASVAVLPGKQPRPGHPLHLKVANVVIAALRAYAIAIGKTELRMVDPLPHAIAFYCSR